MIFLYIKYDKKSKIKSGEYLCVINYVHDIGYFYDVLYYFNNEDKIDYDIIMGVNDFEREGFYKFSGDEFDYGYFKKNNVIAYKKYEEYFE